MSTVKRRLAATVSVLSLAAVVAPVAAAHAAAPALLPGAATLPAGATALPPGATTLPAGAMTPAPVLAGWAGVALRFTPPAVGPLRAVIGPIIIGGRMINPGLDVSTPGVALRPIALGHGG
jgi:hypothetical protein